MLPPTRRQHRGRSRRSNSPQHYRVSIFRKSETLPVWFWECWYCLCCCCACCCCACGTCCVCGCCWMYPTVLCCGTLVCKNVDVDPPCTSPWAICGQRRDMNMTVLWAADRTPVTRFVCQIFPAINNLIFDWDAQISWCIHECYL